MENNNWIFSDEYRKMIKNMNQITKNLSPKFDALCRNNLQLRSILKTNINQEMLSAIAGFKKQMVDFTRFSKQLSEVFPSFQLSEKVREFIRETKESESLSEEEFEKKYGGEFEICKTLGEHGWVVSEHSNPKYIKNWYKALIEDEPEKITEFFEADECCVIKNIVSTLDTKYDDPVNKNYYSRGIKAFRNKDYMTSAMYLVGLIETRVNALVQFPDRAKYKEKFSNKGFAEMKKEQFEGSNSFFVKRYHFLNVYPSLIAFLNRLFVDGEYTFKRGVEPPYINRNWLLHGKCCREIERLADIIDFDPKRTPSVLFSHLAVKNPVSLNEWKKHQSINAWTISPKRILFSAQCEHPAIEATILAFCNQIDEELRNGTVILSNLSDDGMGINMETYKIPLPPQVDRRKIQAKKDIISGKPIYRYHDTKFSLSKKQIIDLLMGTKLYGKPEVALRELLQNSIDACLLRQKLSELWGIEYTPKVKVSLYTKNNVDYLQVSDNGVGMNQHIIDNYYTNIGCSYYSSREFSDLMVSFKSSFTPISRFGIGILSCFMVCDSMEVTTRRIRERFECDEALHVSIEGYESLFVISDSDKKDPGTDTILTLRPVHPWDRMDEDEFVQCIKGIVPNPAVQIEIETDKRSESYSSDYFDDLDLSPLLDYSWNNTKNIRKIDIDLTCEEYGFKGRGCIGLLIKNDMPVEEIEILSKDVEIDGEIYTLSSSVKYKNNCITETSTSISVDEDGEIDTNTSWSERFKSKSSLSIHGIEVPYNLFPNYSNKMSKAVLNIPFPFSFRLDIGVNSDLNLNSARDQIIYDEKWLTFEENLYQVICKRLKEQLSLSDWERLNEIIQKNGKNIFSRVANNIE